MNASSKTIFVLTLLAVLFACGDDSSEINIQDPSNVTISIQISETNKGEVAITAQGDNVVEYQFDFGDGSEVVTNTSGIINYTYSETGSYTIEVKAFGSSGRFLKETRTISVLLGDDTSPISDEGYSTPLSYDGMMLIWNDEFDGSSLNQEDWNYEIGGHGWGNNELQYYRENNTTVNEGYLIIEARKESFNGSAYTSSRLTTQGKFDFKYGRVDIRARLPKGQGIWPALWMLGANFNTVGWPYCGEVDIMEMIGGGDGRDNVVHGTLHWDNNGTKADSGGSTKLSEGIFNDEFHVFTIIWDENQVVWYLDDQQFNVINITPADLSEFQKEFFLIFNIAVGGNWPGSPNTSTVFPQQMLVDYVRVFQDE